MTQTMLAAVFEAPGKLALKQIPVPRIDRADQALLKVDAVSICGTDVHITANPPGYAATPGTILGHEIAGTVVEMGADVKDLEIGDRVVVNPNNFCGTCAYCRKNLPNECLKIEALGIDYDGGFAEYCRVSGKAVYRISRDVPVEAAACAEPLACAINGLKKVCVVPGDCAAVIGGGPIGLMLAMLLRASGAGRVILMEVAGYRIDFARSLGFELVNPAAQDAKRAVLEASELGADIVFDVTGSQMAAAVDLARKGGSVVLFGVNKRALPAVPQCEITTKELKVLGTWLANATFPEAVRVLEQRAIDVGALVTDVVPLAAVNEGIEKLARGEAVKIIVRP